MSVFANRPAETGGVAAAAALLIARALGVTDSTTILSLAVVIGFVPAAITFVVELLRKRSSSSSTTGGAGGGGGP